MNSCYEMDCYIVMNSHDSVTERLAYNEHLALRIE